MSAPRKSPSTRPSVLYQISLALVAVTMAVLPWFYVALTALAGYGVYWFAQHGFAAVWAWPIGLNKITLLVKIVCSCTPLLVGGAVAFAMVKPLFARRPARMQPLALDPQFEPRVYSLVRQICGIVGAPAPRRIELNCDLNASAGFERGFGGFFGNRLILTLGMPLVGGLTERELAGVIAHEFGHFRQGAGMRLSYLIRRVNGWFARVIYERDAWDEAISDWSRDSEGLTVMFMFGCASMGVGISRGVLWLLMIFGHAVSAVLLRQMEYDADRSEILLSGSAAFESAMMKFASLGAVLTDIHQGMRRSWRDKFQLPDNLPVLVEYRATRMPAEKRAKLENEFTLTKTHPLDTHPSAADRVRRARQLGEPGYDISDAPARELFENFDSLSRLVTLAHYEDDLNVPTTSDFLIPLEQLLRAEMAKSAPTSAADASGSAVQAVAPAEAAKPKIRMLSFDPSRIPTRKPKEGSD